MFGEKRKVEIYDGGNYFHRTEANIYFDDYTICLRREDGIRGGYDNRWGFPQLYDFENDYILYKGKYTLKADAERDRMNDLEAEVAKEKEQKMNERINSLVSRLPPPPDHSGSTIPPSQIEEVKC